MPSTILIFLYIGPGKSPIPPTPLQKMTRKAAFANVVLLPSTEEYLN